MKKLMLTTALAGSLIASAALAEIKVSGAMEVTLGSGETPSTSTKTNQGSTIGYETSIRFQGGTKLSNGTEVKLNANFEDSTMTDQAIYFVSGANQMYIGTDQNGGNLDDGHTTPVIANRIEDGNLGLVVTYNPDKASIHSQDVVGFMTTTGVGNFSVAYAPKIGNAGGGDSNPAATAKSGSAYAIGYAGDLGVKGLSAIVSYTDRTTNSLDAQSITATKVGLGYTMGAISVGANQTTIDDSNTGTSFVAGGEYKTTSASVVYAINDAISIGYQVGKLETNAGGASTDEDLRSLTVGYNLGGTVVTAQYHEVENRGTVAGVDGEAIELRIVQAF
jgi:hypothetical protein